jgi:V8-like Glu-specific endopeptidase
MRRFFNLLLVLFALAGVAAAQTGVPVSPSASELPSPHLSDREFIDTVYYPATVLLFSQNEDGGMRMLCTATAIEKTAKGYTFVTAAHCASQDDHETHRADASKSAFFISSDAIHTKTFIEAKVIACGYQERGDDFCLLSVETTANFSIVKVGDDSTSISGDQIVNIASPDGLGKQVFYGRVSMPRLDRTLRQDDGDINWTNAMLVQLPGTNGGSSGSSVVCLDQQAICGFLVGIYDKTMQVAIPVSRFKSFRTAVENGTYKWFSSDSDDNSVPSLVVKSRH